MMSDPWSRNKLDLRKVPDLDKFRKCQTYLYDEMKRCGKPVKYEVKNNMGTFSSVGKKYCAECAKEFYEEYIMEAQFNYFFKKTK